ncbi:unnamed protein product, partial [Gulo gulo]
MASSRRLFTAVIMSSAPRTASRSFHSSADICCLVSMWSCTEYVMRMRWQSAVKICSFSSDVNSKNSEVSSFSRNSSCTSLSSN